MNDEYWRQLLELSVALEIAKMERDACREMNAMLKQQLSELLHRAKDAESRLQEATTMLFTISREAIEARPRSTATEVMVDGRSVLRLGHPVTD